MSPYDDGRPALTEANRAAYSFASRLEHHVSIAAAAGARKRVAAAIRRELAAIQTEIDTTANTSTTPNTSTARRAGT